MPPAEMEDVLRVTWRRLRAKLLPEFIREHPGRRPWAWWWFDAPEARRLLAGPGPAPERETRLYFGVPVDRGGSTMPTGGTYETETFFLRRHRLLLSGERTACAATED